MDSTIIPEGLLALAAREQRGWKARLDMLAASGVPVNVYESGMTSRPDPFGTFVDADGRIVTDPFTATPTEIGAVVRDLTVENQGYWIDNLFNTPGNLITGGAVKYFIAAPDDHFLPAGQLMPRSPGSEAPRIRGTRQRPGVGYPQSISASIELADETRQRNDGLVQFQHTLQQASNSFVQYFQGLGEAALDALLVLTGETVTAGSGTFGDWFDAEPVDYLGADPVAHPRMSEEFARIKRLFYEDKSGIQPDTVVWAPEDAEEFDRVYGDRGTALLARYGLTNQYVSLRRTPGKRLYLKAGQVGTKLWEKPMGDPEYVREGTRLTDVWVMEGRVIYVANGGDAIKEVAGTTS